MRSRVDWLFLTSRRHGRAERPSFVPNARAWTANPDGKSHPCEISYHRSFLLPSASCRRRASRGAAAGPSGAGSWPGRASRRSSTTACCRPPPARSGYDKGLVAFFADDAILLAPLQPIIRGKAAAKAYYESIDPSGTQRLTHIATRVRPTRATKAQAMPIVSGAAAASSRSGPCRRTSRANLTGRLISRPRASLGR